MQANANKLFECSRFFCVFRRNRMRRFVVCSFLVMAFHAFAHGAETSHSNRVMVAYSNDVVMRDVYCIIPAVNKGKMPKMPFLMPWSMPEFMATTNGFTVGRVYSLGIAEDAIYRHGFSVCATNSAESGFAEIIPHEYGYKWRWLDNGTARYERVYKVLQASTLPTSGLWRVLSVDGRVWNGKIDGHRGAFFNDYNEVIRELVVASIVPHLPRDVVTAGVYSVSAQIDGYSGPLSFYSGRKRGALIAGYMDGCMPIGVWLIADSVGLNLKMFLDGRDSGTTINGIYGLDELNQFVFCINAPPDYGVYLRYKKAVGLSGLWAWSSKANSPLFGIEWNQDGNLSRAWLEETGVRPYQVELLGPE